MAEENAPVEVEGKKFLGSFSTEEAKEEPKEVVEEVKPEPVVKTGEEFWKSLSDKAGFELKSEDQVLEHLKGKRDLEVKYKEIEQKAKNYEGLDSLSLDIDKATKAGIDVDLYWNARKMEVEKLDPKEALRQKFYREKPKLPRTTADILFDDEYESRYGILNQPLGEAEKEASAKKLELAKARLESDTQEARDFLSEWKAKHVTIPEAKKPEVATGVTEEQAAKIYGDYENQAKEFLSSVGEIEIPVGDKVFKFGIEDHLKDIESDLLNPIETLKKLGIDLVAQTFNAEKLGETLAKLKALEHIGKPLSDWGLEQSNAQHVKVKLESPAPTQPLAGGQPKEKTTDEKVAEAFEAQRLARRQA